MTDADIKSENFLEYINSFLSTGEIAGHIAKDKKDVFVLESKTFYMKEQGKKGEDPQTRELWLYVINRIRDCLHIVLSFSPVGYNLLREHVSSLHCLVHAQSIGSYSGQRKLLSQCLTHLFQKNLFIIAKMRKLKLNSKTTWVKCMIVPSKIYPGYPGSKFSKSLKENFKGLYLLSFHKN